MPQTQWQDPKPSQAPRKRTSTTKIVLITLAGIMVLFVGGCAVLAVGVSKAVDDEVTGQPEKMPDPEKAGGTQPEDSGKEKSGKDETAVLGKDTVALNNGLHMTPAAPVQFSPGDFGAGTGKFNYKIKVNFVNRSDKAVDLALATAKFTSDGGATKEITDTANGIGMFDGGSLAPGQSTQMTFGFSTEKSATYVNMDITPGVFKVAKFTYGF